MKITHQRVTIRELIAGFTEDSDTAGVRGYSGKLNIRPPYQREFVYKPAQQLAVIDTVQRGLPLNSMYWHKVTEVDPVTNTSTVQYEVLDGQQRTLSICSYAMGEFSNNAGLLFHSMPADQQEAFLDYELMVYICDGTDSERLAWFERINIAGEKLTQQELRNATYAGQWLSEMRKYFSKTGGPAEQLAVQYLAGSAIRQDFLETALKWMCLKENITGDRAVENYMSSRHHDIVTNVAADPLVQHFRTVINWIETLFPESNYRKQMDGLPWGEFWLKYHNTVYVAAELETKVAALMADDEVTSKTGIYAYVLSGDPRTLSLRSFTKSQRTTLHSKQAGKCAQPQLTGHSADTVFKLAEMEADHIVPWSQGGTTELDNGQMLCKACNRAKSNK